jgi:hypothetical protein
MPKPIAYAVLYTAVAKERTKQAVADTKEYAVEHQSQLKCIGATAVVVGLAARATGFQAGYEFAQTNA